MAHEKVGVSTHVLDIARGRPASGVPVQLERREGPEEWRRIGTGRTDHDGRCANLLADGARLSPGTYRLTFDTADYHWESSIQALHPVVQVIFLVRDGDAHFHLPLLLSPHGYTTYRGS